MRDFTKGSPAKALILFVIPIFFGDLFSMLYGIADTRIVGEFLHDNALAAVSATSILSDIFVTGFLRGITSGFAIVTAKYFGAKNNENIRLSFARTVRLGLLFSFILTALCLVSLDMILKMINIPQEHMAEGKAYIGVLLAGMTFSMLYNAYAATLRSLGDTVTPLIFLIVSCVLNIGLDVLFIAVFKTGVMGAAIATVFSWLLSVVACGIYVHIKYPILHIKLSDLLGKSKIDREMLKNGIPVGVTNCLACVGAVSIQSVVNAFGTDTIVANAAANKIVNLFLVPYGIFGLAMASYASQNYGAKQPKRIAEGLKFLLGISLVWSVFALAVCQMFSDKFVTGLTGTTNSSIIHIASEYLGFNSIFFMACALVLILRSTLQGIGDSTTPMVTSAVELCGRIIAALILAKFFGYWGIIVAVPILWVMMAVILSIKTSHFFC